MGSSLYAYLLFVKKLDLKMLKCIIKKLLITPMSAIYICKNFRIVTSDMRLLQTKIANESQENEISNRLFKSLSLLFPNNQAPVEQLIQTKMLYVGHGQMTYDKVSQKNLFPVQIIILLSERHLQKYALQVHSL